MAGLFSRPKPPTPPAPTPVADTTAIDRARKRATQQVSGSSGRASTILGGSLGTSDKMGG